jgi:tRNA-specific 2-thiouridylase
VGLDLPNQGMMLGSPEQLLKKECVIFGTHWLKALHQLKGLRCNGRISPEKAPLACQVTFFENQTAHVEFDERQGPLFPGQAIVFYQENEVLGGGWIHTTS